MAFGDSSLGIFAFPRFLHVPICIMGKCSSCSDSFYRWWYFLVTKQAICGGQTEAVGAFGSQASFEKSCMVATPDSSWLHQWSDARATCEDTLSERAKGRDSWNDKQNLEEALEILSRSYTPVSAPSSRTMDLIVRHYPPSPDRGFKDGGRASAYLVEQLKIGAEIPVSGPHGHRLYQGQGNFLVGQQKVQVRRVTAIAGGSGITPVLAVLRELRLEAKRARKGQDFIVHEFYVLHVNTTSEDSLPRDWYDPIEEMGLEPTCHVYNVAKVWSNTENEESIGGINNYQRQEKLTEELIRRVFPLPLPDTVTLVCGPQGFVRDLCQPLLKKVGYQHVVALS